MTPNFLFFLGRVCCFYTWGEEMEEVGFLEHRNGRIADGDSASGHASFSTIMRMAVHNQIGAPFIRRFSEEITS